MPGGYEQADLTLPRTTEGDHADLARLSTLTIRNAGEPVGEYRLERVPRVSGDELAVSPGLVGWQAALEDDEAAQMVYVDADLSSWTEPYGTQRDIQAALGVTNHEFSVDSDSALPRLRLTLSGPHPDRQPNSEAWYDGGPAGIREVRYTPSYAPFVLPSDANYSVSAGLGIEDNVANMGVGFFLQPDVFPSTASQTYSYTPGTGGRPARYAMLRFAHTAGFGADGWDFDAFMSKVAVIGAHGRPVFTTPFGTAAMRASDVVADAVSRWAPSLNFTEGDYGTVRPSIFLIEHVPFRDPTTVGEIVRAVSVYELPYWAVWDDRTFHYDVSRQPRKRWRARSGATRVEETGPSVERLWESVIVAYRDVDGTTRTVGPPGSGAHVERTELKDDDPENPANQLGIVRRDLLQLETATLESAVAVGQRFLQTAKELDSSGQATIAGTVEDDRGVVHPFSRVRSGDEIAFVDSADDSYRRVAHTSKDYAGRSCQVDLDAPPEALQALLERLGATLIPLGV
jgi:hypothetical protein